MDTSTIISLFVHQLQSPTLGFLIAGMLIAAIKSEFRVPQPIYDFTVYMLLMTIGLEGGIAIREANIIEMLVPAVFCIIIGSGIVLLGYFTFARLPGLRKDDALATLGLFGAVSSSTMFAGMTFLQDRGIFFEAWVPALYPFMDIPALVTAILLANICLAKQSQSIEKVDVKALAKECVTGKALTILIFVVLLGLLTKPEPLFETFYEPLFKGFLSVLMLTLGIDAYQRLKELAKVAHWYALFAVVGPMVHGMIGFGFGYLAHHLVGFSPGGVIMLAIIAASNSDISGPPTLRAGIPSANPSAYIGASTGIGTTVAIGICVPLFTALGTAVFNL